MKTSFVDKLDSLREALSFPLKVSSGYRCPEHNTEVSSTGPSGPHTTGRAADLLVSRKEAYKLISYATAFGFTGLGFSQKGATRFIHLDDLDDAPGQPRPTIWSY